MAAASMQDVRAVQLSSSAAHETIQRSLQVLEAEFEALRQQGVSCEGEKYERLKAAWTIVWPFLNSAQQESLGCVVAQFFDWCRESRLEGAAVFKKMIASTCPGVPGEHYYMKWCAFESALFAAAREAAAREAAAQRRLQEKRDAFDKLIAPEIRTNYAIPLHLLMTEHPDAHELGVPEEQQARLREYFAWCVSFSKAFAKGGYALSMWFTERGFLHIPPTKLRQEGASAAGGAASQEGGNKQAELPSASGATYVQEGSQTVRKLVINLVKCFQKMTDDDDAALADFTVKKRPVQSFPSECLEQVIVIDKDQHGNDTEECVALLAKVPIQGTNSYGRTFGRESFGAALPSDSPHPTGQAVLPELPSPRQTLDGVMLPEVQVTLTGWRTTSNCVPVEYEEFLFTAPRVHLLLNCAEVGIRPRAGVQLAGVHGSGKTTLLRALVGILTVGAQTDAWYLPEAFHLHDSRMWGCFLRSSSGSLAQGNGYESDNRPADRTTGTELQKLLASVSEGKDLWRQHRITDLTFTGDRKVTHIAKREDIDNLKLTIYDEVNEVVSDLQDKNAASFLKWHQLYQPECLRILASSPDGYRETYKDGCEPLFFELRPPPARHMAAILHVASDRLVPQLQSSELWSLDLLLDACTALGSNMRELSLLLFAADEHCRMLQSSAGFEAGSAAAQKWRNEQFALVFDRVHGHVVNKLAVRMLKQTSTPPQDSEHRVLHLPRFHDDDQSGSAMLSRFMKVNASLLVRDIATERTKTEFVPVSTIMYQVQEMAFMMALQKSQGSDEDADLLGTLVNLNLSDGNKFEDQLAGRLFLRKVSATALPLQELPQAINLYLSGDLRAPAFTFGQRLKGSVLDGILWHTESEKVGGALSPVLIRLKSTTEVDSRVFLALRNAQENRNIVIQTATNAPYCDFIVFRRERTQIKVLFVEGTVSSMYDHSRKKSSLQVPFGADTATPLSESSSAPDRQDESGDLAVGDDTHCGMHLHASAQPTSSSSAGAADAGGQRRSSRLAGMARQKREQWALDHGPEHMVFLPPTEAAHVKTLAPSSQNSEQDLAQADQHTESARPALRDLLHLLCTPMYTVNSKKKGWTFDSPQNGDEALSVGNAWLHLLGAPVRFGSVFDKVNNRYRVTLDGIMDSPCSDSTLPWKVGVVFVSGETLKNQRHAGLEQLDCPFAFSVYRELLAKVLTRLASRASSPSASKAKP